MLRPLLIAEENKLARSANQQGESQARALEEVLQSCVTEVIDFGPYREGVTLDWPAVLSGDKFALMLELRKRSYRDGRKIIMLDVQCPRGRCTPTDYSVDLDTDVMVREITDEVFDHVRDGVPFEVQIAGKLVTFLPATGRTEEAAQKLERQHPGRNMAVLLRSRIQDVEGIERRDILDWIDGNNGASKTFEGLSSQDGEDLRDAFDAVECGVDTEVSLTCEHCGRSWSFPLPFDGGFLAPATEIRKRRRERRRGKG